MTRLYLVRHGTHDLVGKVLAGRMAGVSLSGTGRSQAEGLARFFAGQAGVSLVMSSPLERCLETAAPIARRLGLDVTVSHALNELDCGDWTGCTFDALAEDARWHVWNAARARAVVPGGETAAAVVARVMPLLTRVADGEQGSVVMVTHSDVIKGVLLTMLGAALDGHDRIAIEPGSITTLDLWPGGGKLVRSNQVVAA